MSTTGNDNFAPLANQSLNMNNFNINNLLDSVQGQDQQAVTRKQTYRIGETIISPISNLQTIYPYLLRCDGQVYNTTTYATLFSRLSTNVLLNGYQSFNDYLVIYDAVPTSGTNSIAITWNNVVQNCDLLVIQIQNSSKDWFGSQEIPTQYIVNGVSPSQWIFKRNDDLITLNTSGISITADTNLNGINFQFAFVGAISGARFRFVLKGLKNVLQKNYQYIIAL